MNYIRKVKAIFDYLINKIIIKHYQVSLGANLKIKGTIHYSGTKNRLWLGNNVVINSEKYGIPIGFPNKCSFWIIDNGSINIDNNTGISNTAICSMSKVSIGKNCLLGGGVKIYDTDFHSIDYKKRRETDTDIDRRTQPVIIGNDVFIGAGSYILKGTIIGDCSVIGAGSVVCGHVPSGEIWAGNPAKFIKRIEGNDENTLDNKC